MNDIEIRKSRNYFFKKKKIKNLNLKNEHLSQAAVWKLTGHLIGAHSLSSIDHESPNSLVDLATVPSGVRWSSLDFRL
jgi:hypothetical protein